MLDKGAKPPAYKIAQHEYPNELGYDWMTHVFEANLWMASGRTRSQLHYDKEWNVNCLLSGTKKWIFLDPFKYDEDIPWARGEKFLRKNPLNNRWTDWVWLDPDRVDLIVQHKLRNFDYIELIQEPGDCIFIPYAMLHQVEKIGDDLQVAASWMFLPESIYDEEACASAPLNEDLPLAAMDTLYAYNGSGVIPQGYGDPYYFSRRVMAEHRQSGSTHLTLKTFSNIVSRGSAILRGKKGRIKKLFEFISSYAEDPKKGLRTDEIRKVPLRVWCKPAAEGDEEGPLPCDVGEEYHVLTEAELNKMREHIEGVRAKMPPKAQDDGSASAEPLNHSRIPGKGGLGTTIAGRARRAKAGGEL